MVSQTQLLEVYTELEKRITEVNLRQGGPRGAKGRKGDTGAQGAQGPSGAKGPQGNTGSTGKQGSQGPIGPSGARGPQGDSVQGHTGEQGPQGSIGPSGAIGPQGEAGVSIVDAVIDLDGHLTLYLSDGDVIDAGLILASDEGNITYIAGGGVPDQYKEDLAQVIEDLNNHLADFGNPHQVAHDQLIDPDNTTGEAWVDKHHPQFHDLESHTDVTLIDPKPNQGLFLLDDGVTWGNHAGFMESWPTGLASGGELNIGPGANDIEVITGFGVVANNYTDPLDPPLIQGLQWPQIVTAITGGVIKEVEVKPPHKGKRS